MVKSVESWLVKFAPGRGRVGFWGGIGVGRLGFSIKVAVFSILSIFIPHRKMRPRGGRRQHVRRNPKRIKEVDAVAFMRYPEPTLHHDLLSVNRFRADSCIFYELGGSPRGTGRLCLLHPR